jgi:hypothetical protein
LLARAALHPVPPASTPISAAAPERGRIRSRAPFPGRAAFAVIALSLLGACRSYGDRTQSALRHFESGEFEQARTEFSDKEVTKSPFLMGAESGMASLAAGQWEQAQQDFDAAAAAVKKYEDRAILGAEAVGEELTSLLINESMSEYPGEGYERAQLHAALALTYLARGDLDGVYVETRRANKLLEGDEKLYEKKYAAGGFAHFMSAVSYELQQQYDDAYIDYNRMAEKGVGVELAGKALVRIAKRLRYDDVLGSLVESHGEPAQVPEDAAQVVVIAGVGLGPFKQEQTVSLPAPQGLLQFSVPVFVARPQAVSALELRVDGGAALQTSVIENVGAVARENLNDRMAWLAMRSALRGALKYGITAVGSEMAKDKNNQGTGLAVLAAGVIFTAVTERADTRSWLTVPDSWQAARMFVAPGEHELVLDAVGGESKALGRVRIAPGETVFVLARTLGGALHVHRIGGESLDAPAPPPPNPPQPSTTPSSESNEAQP